MDPHAEAPIRGFESVVVDELPVLYRVAKRLTLNEVEAEDVVAQALLKAARTWSTFDGRFARSWLIQIIRNVHLETLRRAKSRPVTVSDALAEADRLAVDTLWEEVARRALRSQVLLELDNLPEEFRMAVALCDMEELSYEEAAYAMEVSIGTVKSRVFRGRRMLRARMESLGWLEPSNVELK